MALDLDVIVFLKEAIKIKIIQKAYIERIEEELLVPTQMYGLSSPHSSSSSSSFLD